jgi:hypothetical protein
VAPQRRHRRRTGWPTQGSGSGVVLVVAIILAGGVRAGAPADGTVALTADARSCLGPIC